VNGSGRAARASQFGRAGGLSSCKVDGGDCYACFCALIASGLRVAGARDWAGSESERVLRPIQHNAPYSRLPWTLGQPALYRRESHRLVTVVGTPPRGRLAGPTPPVSRGVPPPSTTARLLSRPAPCPQGHARQPVPSIAADVHHGATREPPCRTPPPAPRSSVLARAFRRQKSDIVSGKRFSTIGSAIVGS
jgi:hypothetical protein